VWALLSTYLNSPINEMYVTLRADPVDGRILPHLVVRQLPYTTDAAAVEAVLRQDAIDQEMGTGREHRHHEEWQAKVDATLAAAAKKQGRKLPPKLPPKKPAAGTSVKASALDITQFQELPRWVVSPDLCYSMAVGRSESMRFNFVHISGVGIGSTVDQIGSFVRCEPNMDELDIKRNGLRPYRTTVNCLFKDMRKGATAWRDLMTDVVIGQHLMLSGTMTIVGVVAPIAVGDNLEFENVVYHIEQVTHTSRIDPTGRRMFTSTLQLSHGVTEQSVRAAGRSAVFAATAGGPPGTGVVDLPVTEE
jgi:hypothetical protein